MEKNENPLSIVFFYTEVMGYVEGTFQALLDSNESIHITTVHWDKKKLTPFCVKDNKRIKYFLRSNFDITKLFELLISIEPKILYLSGWMDKGYIKAARQYKKINPSVIVVNGIDDQWHGTLRQLIGRIYFNFYYRSLFDYMWVTGMPQYHYARKMGYSDKNIISNFYSANTYTFKEKACISKRFVFVGRFHPVKGIANLLAAYNLLSEEIQREWPLILIGSGPLVNEISKAKTDNIIIHSFLQPDELNIELLKGGVFCLPSVDEPWGVVIHELAILGYPLLLSSVCGAASEFLINGYNGFAFEPNDVEFLRFTLNKVATLSESELHLFSERSHQMGKRINSKISASSLLSIIH